MNLWLDLETASTENLPQVGVHRYARAARILLNAWAIDDGPVRVEDHLSLDFLHAFQQADRIFAHNAEFDRTILTGRMPDIRFDRWYCTMAQARRHGLPGGLDKLCEIMGVPADKAKLKEGRELVLLFCKPRPDGSWATRETHPDKWERFVQYAGNDIEAMRVLHAKMPKWNDEYELPIWLADQRINARGFAVDTQFAQAAIELLDDLRDETDEKVVEATGGAVDSARQVRATLDFLLSEFGVDLPDLQAATLERRINDPDLPEPVRELLALRQQSSKTSTGKYKAVLRGVDTDGRMRGTLSFCGAMRTKRWAGQKFQPHNLPRAKIGALKGEALKREIANGITAIKAGVFDLVSMHPLTEVASSAIRGVVVPGEGKKLVIGDYSNVEGRALAWLAGEEWKLQAFRDYDAGRGEDLYKLAYARAFGVAVEDADEKQRQVGKVMELMLGFGGGVSAFVTGATTYRVDLHDLVDAAWPGVPEHVKAETKRMWEWAVSEKRTYGLTEEVFRVCDALKRMWREKHPRIVQFWSDLEAAFRDVLAGARPVQVGRLTVEKRGAWVRIIGPAGDCICYPGAKLKGDKIVYLGQNQYTRTWGEIGTYGGKLAENVTQWTCRNLLAESHLNAERVHLDVVLHVHDENVAEVPQGRQDKYMIELLRECMTDIEWADGLPLAVAAHVAQRYGKD